jgi:hypothetical protein
MAWTVLKNAVDPEAEDDEVDEDEDEDEEEEEEDDDDDEDGPGGVVDPPAPPPPPHAERATVNASDTAPAPMTRRLRVNCRMSFGQFSLIICRISSFLQTHLLLGQRPVKPISYHYRTGVVQY